MNPTCSAVKNRIGSFNGYTRGENRFYCSIGCKQSCPIYWKKEWARGFNPTTSREVQPELRKLTLLRDNYTCQKCGKTKNEISIHCHHIIPVINDPIISADVDNCITLCKNCHKLAHKIDGCKTHQLRC